MSKDDDNEAREAARRLAERIAADPCYITKVGLDGIAVQSTVAHNDAWVWANGVMTERVACTTCGRERVNGQTNPNMGETSVLR